MNKNNINIKLLYTKHTSNLSVNVKSTENFTK